MLTKSKAKGGFEASVSLSIEKQNNCMVFYYHNRMPLCRQFEVFLVISQKIIHCLCHQFDLNEHNILALVMAI